MINYDRIKAMNINEMAMFIAGIYDYEYESSVYNKVESGKHICGDFIPDYDEFKCGMNGYRNVDFINRVDDSDVAKSVDEIIAQIEKFFETNKGMPYEVDFLKIRHVVRRI